MSIAEAFHCNSSFHPGLSSVRLLSSAFSACAPIHAVFVFSFSLSLSHFFFFYFFFLFNSSGSYPYLHSFTFSSFPSLFAYFYIPLYYNRFYYVIYIQWNGGSMNIHLESIVVNSLDWLNERIKWSEESAQFMCLTFTRKQSNSSCFSRGT